MKHEEYNLRYNEIMFDERDEIVAFLKKQANLCWGNQMWTWAFEPKPILRKRNDDYISVEHIRLYDGNLEIFDACDAKKPLFAEDFYYNELSKILDALPEVENIVMQRVLTELSEIGKNYNVSAILREHPVSWTDNKSKFTVESVWEENNGIRLEVHEMLEGGKEGGYGIWESIDTEKAEGIVTHIKTWVLRNSEEYEKLKYLLGGWRCREGYYNFVEHETVGAVSITPFGTDISLDVLDIDFNDSEGLHILVSIADTGLMKNDETDMMLFESDLTPDNLKDLVKFFSSDIIDIYNGHDKELVKKINDAWNNPKYESSFGQILLALLTRDQKEYEDKYDTDASLTEEYAYEHAHEIMEGVCDDWDLETIISFIRYEENEED